MSDAVALDYELAIYNPDTEQYVMSLALTQEQAATLKALAKADPGITGLEYPIDAYIGLARRPK